MTKEEKQLLLKDICARLHYGVKIKTSNGDGILCSIDYIPDGTYLGVSINGAVKEYFEYQDTKPYLRSISNMTEEEAKTYKTLNVVNVFLYVDNGAALDYLNSIHIDYRGLIPLGLALEAPEGMYKF